MIEDKAFNLLNQIQILKPLVLHYYQAFKNNIVKNSINFSNYYHCYSLNQEEEAYNSYYCKSCSFNNLIVNCYFNIKDFMDAKSHMIVITSNFMKGFNFTYDFISSSTMNFVEEVVTYTLNLRDNYINFENFNSKRKIIDNSPLKVYFSYSI